MIRVSARGLSVAVACPALLAASFGCSRAEPKFDPARLRGSNVLLVTIDTLRRDRLGAYGNRDHLTPTLDALASSGLRYDRAYSHVPMTLPAHASILTGLTPAHHGVRNNVAFRLDANTPTLATTMKAAAYRTGAFVGAFVLDARFGLSRGFDTYDDRTLHGTGTTSFAFAQRRAADVVRAAGDWILNRQSSIDNRQSTIDNRQSPWLAWVHLFDPHAPYDAPAEYRGGRAPYDAEVAYADAMLGALLARLREAGALAHTLIIVTADHGESLGEHGERTHGLFAYEATLAVPLVMAGPGVPQGVSSRLVGHVDLLPTVAELTGVRGPQGLDGHSLAQPPATDRPIYFEALDANLTRGWAPLRGVIDGTWKYIDLPIRELYDLARDPHEVTNLAGRDPRRIDLFSRELGAVTATERTGGSVAIDAEAAARLRSLGYVGSVKASPGEEASVSGKPSRAGPAAPFTEQDDPKTLAPANEAFNAALEAFNAGRPVDALNAFTALLHQRPDFVTARTSAATVLLAMGRATDAVSLLRAAPPDERDSPELLAKLGAALRDAGDLAGAAAAFERAQQAGDQNPDLFNDRGVVYARLGRTEDARRMFAALLDQDPEAAGTWYNLGVLELTNRRPDAAAAALRHAVASQPDYGEAWQALGAALVSSDRPAAIDAWRRAERLRPGDFDLLFNLAMVLADSPRPAEALPYLERFAQQAPRDRYARDLPAVNARIAALRGR